MGTVGMNWDSELRFFWCWGHQSLHSNPSLLQISIFVVLDCVHVRKYCTPVKERALFRQLGSELSYHTIPNVHDRINREI